MEHARIEKAIAHIKSDPKLLARMAAIRLRDIQDRVGTIPGAAYHSILRLNCTYRKGFTPDELKEIIRGLQ